MIGAMPEVPAVSIWTRLHGALMPDYNRKATVYWWLVVVLGSAVLVHSLRELALLPPADWLQIGAGIAIAMLAGFFPVRVPGTRNAFTAGEIFVILLLLLHGPPAATLAAAGEGLVAAVRISKRWTSRIATPTMAALAMFIAASAWQLLTSTLQRLGLTGDGIVVVTTILFALVYFVFNTLLLTAVPRLKRNELFQPADVLGMFGWVGIAFVGSASVAALLFLTYKNSGIGVLAAIVPLVAMLLVTVHYYYRHLDADEAVREAAQRQNEIALRHVRELEASERRFHSAFTHASIGMALLSVDGVVLQANVALRTLLGAGDEQLLQRRFDSFVEAADIEAFAQQRRALTERTVETFALELRCLHCDGTPIWVAAHCGFFSEMGTDVPRLILQVQDISARRRAEAGLHQLAFHDSLTGLPNRRRFNELLAQAVERAQGEAKHRFAVMFLDFDRFKLINDSLGHSAGDEFLVQVAQRLQDSVRPRDVVARLGGDEFAILMRHFDHDQDVIALADRLLLVLRHSFSVAGTELRSSASIGITVSGATGITPEEVLRNADIAMYKAKAAGKARYALFDVGLHAELAQRVQLENDLRRALDEAHLTLAYQPLYELAGGTLVGFEAQARWVHAEQGEIAPERFLPVAEESGLSVALTSYVLNRACAQLRRWQAADPAFAALQVQVNVSAKDLGHAGLVARVTAALEEAGLQARHLTLELTETILMERIGAAMPILTELRSLGVGLSVDDFGIGYSSLARLSGLPVDSLKVDRSFVQKLQPASPESAVVAAIVQLGNSLGKRVAADGIETAAQCAQLRAMGCEIGQGHHLSAPLAPEDAERLLASMVSVSSAQT